LHLLRIPIHNNNRQISEHMKITTPLATVCLLALSATASAIPIATTGSADTLVSWATLQNSGSGTEAQFVADYLHVAANTITYSQLSGSGGSTWLSIDGDTSMFAFDFGNTDPLLFVVKTGSGVGVSGVTGTYDQFLFSNVNALRYGVIDLDLLTRTHGQIEIGMVSHVGTSGTTRGVPEPGTWSLMAFGLACIAFVRRKQLASRR
jgi:hypothetical protein